MPSGQTIAPEKIDEAMAELAAGRKGRGPAVLPLPAPGDDRAPGGSAKAGASAPEPVDDDKDGDSDDSGLTEEGRQREIAAQDADLARGLAADAARQTRHEKQAAARAHRAAKEGEAREPDAWRCSAPFAMLPWVVLCDASLKPRAKEVYSAIVRRAVQKDWITASQELLADDIGCCLQTVSRAMGELKKRGLVKVQRRVGTSAKTTLLPLTNVYSRQELACRLNVDRRPDG